MEVERAQAWLKTNGRMSSLSSTDKNEPALVEKFARHTFLMPMNNGPIVRLGLDESLTYEQAEEIASALRGRCLSPMVETEGNNVCREGIKIDQSAWDEISKCPIQSKTSPSLTGLRFNSPATVFYLICSSADHCQTFNTGKFQLEFLAAQPAATRTLGKIFDLIWPSGVCDESIKQTSPEKINNVHVTTN